LRRSSSSLDPQQPGSPAAAAAEHVQQHHHHLQQQHGGLGAEAFLYPDEASGSGFIGPISTQIRHSVEEALKAIVHIPGSSSSGSSRQPQWQGLYQIEWEQEQLQWQQQQQRQQQLQDAVQEQQQQWQQQHIVQQPAHAAAGQAPISTAHVVSSSSSSDAASVTPHALTRQIQGCKDAAVLELLLLQQWPRLDHIHVAAAFTQLARITRSSSSSSSSFSASTLQQLQQLAATQLPAMQSRHVSNILWAAAALNLNPPEPWTLRFMDRAQQLFQQGTAPQGFANILWALANLRVNPNEAWMRAFFAASQRQLANFQAQELSSTLWALGSLGMQPPAAWMTAFVAASTAKMATCSAQALSNMLWAAAKLGLGMPEPWLEAVAYTAQLRAAEFSPLGLSNLLWAAAKLSGKQQQQQQQQQLQRRRQGMGSTDPLALSSSSSSSSSSSEGARWLQPLLTAAVPQLPQYNAHCLSNVVWSLAVLDHHSSPAFVAAAAQQLLQKADKLSAAGAASAVWGLARLGVLPDPQLQLAPLLQQLQQVLPQARAQHLVYVAAAMAYFRQQQQQQQKEQQRELVFQQQQLVPGSEELLSVELQQQFLATCQQQLQQQQFAAGQLCQLGRWLAAAAVQPQQPWTDAYLSYIVQQLARLNPSHHLVVLQTLGAWQLKPHAGWAAMFLAAVAGEQAVSRYSAGHIGALLQGFAAAQVQPQQQQLELLLQQVLLAAHNQSGSSSSSDGAAAASEAAAAAAAVLQGLCGLGFRPPERWLQRFWQPGEQGQLLGADSASLASLAAALQLPELSQLQIRPSKLWGLGFHAAVAAALVADPSFTARQAAAVLAALGTTKRQPKEQQQQQQLLPQLMAVAGGGLQQMPYAEAVAAWWALVEFQVLKEAVPMHVLQQQQQPAGPEQQCHWLQHLLLSPTAAQQLQQLQLHSLLQLSDALGRLQQPTPSTWAAAYVDAISGYLPMLHSHQLLSVLCAVPALGGAAQHAQLTSALLDSLQPQLQHLSPKQLSEALVSVQRSGALPRQRWLDDCVAAAADKLDAFLGRQLICMLGSFARLRYCPESSFLAAANDAAVDRLGPGVPASLLVELLWALAALHVAPGAAWLARFEARLLEKAPERLEGAQLARLGWCLAALQVRFMTLSSSSALSKTTLVPY
jgi:hypothetical protein